METAKLWTSIVLLLVLCQGCGGGNNTNTTHTVVLSDPSNLVYPQTNITATVGTAISPDVPTVTGTVDFYSVTPSLPTGLSLNSSTGTISGAPSAVSPQTNYTVVAANQTGSTSAKIQVTVVSNASKAPSTVLELGHSATVNLLQLQDSRLLSRDGNGHWVLWDYASGGILTSGDQVPNTNPPPVLAGNTLVVGIPNGLEVRSSADGRVLSTITSQNSWWKLATDGSYICAGSPSGLSAWSPNGVLLFSRAGDYSIANGFAAPDAVRIGLGPAGQNVVETISIPSGTSSVSPPFSGQFNSWFLDGAQFLTNLSNTVWTYSNTGVQQTVVILPTIENLTGQGNWIWTFQADTPGYPLSVYAIGSSSPAASYSLDVLELVKPSGMTIGAVPYGTGAISVIDLSGTSPVKKDYALPIASGTAYAAASASQWIVGNTHGVVLDGASLSGTPRFISLGQAWSIAGGTGRAAIATAAGTVFYVDPSGPILEGTINFSSSKVQLSSDGTVLAAMADENDAQYETDRTLKVFSIPTGTLINSWPYLFEQGPFLLDFSLSGSGTVIGQVLGSFNGQNWDYARQASAIIGGATLWSDTLEQLLLSDPNTDLSIQISPDGTLIAVSNSGPGPSATTDIYKNGSLITAVPGWVVGWIDNGRLLVNNYVAVGAVYNSQYSGATVYDPTGVKLAAPTLPELRQFQTVTSDWIYSPFLNTIFSLSSGIAVWTSANPSLRVGAVSGPYVVFASGSRVLVDSY